MENIWKVKSTKNGKWIEWVKDEKDIFFFAWMPEKNQVSLK